MSTKHNQYVWHANARGSGVCSLRAFESEVGCGGI